MPFQTSPPLESERLLLRLVQEDDLPALFEINSDDAVTRCLPYASWQSFADAEAWFKRMSGLNASGDALMFVIVNNTSNMVIGTCVLFGYEEGNASAEIGYVLGRAHWGSGFMHEALTVLITHAFDAVGLRRLEAHIDSRNPASERVMARLGFTREGVLRQRWVTRGEISDAIIYGLLRHEWPSFPMTKS